MNYENYRPDWNKPSIFTAQQYGTKVSVEVERSDMDLDEVMDAFQTLLIGMGYHQDSFKNWVLERASEYQEEEDEKWEDAITSMQQDEERYENLRNRFAKVNEEEEDEFFGKWDEERIDIIGQNGNEGLHYHKEGVDELLKRYNDPETQKRLNVLRDEELGIIDGYRATEEDEDEFDDYGQRIHPTFEWGDEPEDDEEIEPLFDGDEWKANENLKAANERYKKEVKKMNAKQKRQSKK